MAREKNNREFGDLLREGLSSVSRRKRKQMHAVEEEIASQIGVSRSTIQKWCQGQIPQNFEPYLIEQLSVYSAQNGRVNREWAQSLLHHVRYSGSESHDSREAFLNALFPNTVTQRPNIFMCTQRGAEPDGTVSLQISNALIERCNVFRDHARSLEADSGWVERVEGQLRQADYMIVFLSAESVQSEVILAQIEIVNSLRDQTGIGPAILPVRLAYTRPFTGLLSSYLDSLNWAYWEGEHQSPQLIEALQTAIFGGELPLGERGKANLINTAREAQPTPANVSAAAIQRPMPSESMSLAATTYIERASDKIALQAIEQEGVTIPIKGPRQMGKSSLLVRIANKAQAAGKMVAVLDFHLLRPSLSNADAFFKEFCVWLSIALGVEDRTFDYWSGPAPNPRRCTHYVGRHLLESVDRPVVLLIDNADWIFTTDFHVAFFAMLRSWHNLRSYEPMWERLDLVLATSTEPLSFINDINQSPFNVGEVIELADFSQEEVADLNSRYGSPLTQSEISRLMPLLHGQPYLVHRALYQVATGRTTSDDLFLDSNQGSGAIFGDHLRSLLLRRLYGEQELVDSMREVIQTNRISDKDVFFRLRGAGLVRWEGKDVVPRNQLYADFFRQHFS